MQRGLVWLWACTSVGCGPVVIPGDGDGSGTGGSAGGPVATGSASATATSGWPVTTFADDGTDDDEDDDDGLPWDCGVAPPGTEHHCTVPAPDSVCDPQPAWNVAAWISVDGGALPSDDPGPESYTYACTITDWHGHDTSLLTLELACADGEHTLEVFSTTEPGFDDSGDFVLSVVHGTPGKGGGGQLVTLRRADGELVLAGATGPTAPDHETVPPDFFDPLDVTLLADVCDIESWPGGDFVESCYTQQRQALRFALQGESVDVYDHTAAPLSPYAVLVEHAEQRHDVTCSDLPGHWYSWVAIPPQLD